MNAPYEYDSIIRIPCSVCDRKFDMVKHHDGSTNNPVRYDIAYPTYAAELAKKKGWLVSKNRTLCPKCRREYE